LASEEYYWSYWHWILLQEVIMSEQNEIERSHPTASAVSNVEQSPSLRSQMSPSLEKPSLKSKRRSSSSSSPHRGNRLFNNIVAEQPRVQMKHYHYESFWKKVASEMDRDLAGIPLG
jgi:hypothetical protein